MSDTHYHCPHCGDHYTGTHVCPAATGTAPADALPDSFAGPLTWLPLRPRLERLLTIAKHLRMGTYSIDVTQAELETLLSHFPEE